MKRANYLRVAAVILSVLFPIISMAGYLGKDRLEDPDKVVFILPDNQKQQAATRLKGSRVFIYFDHPVSISSQMNLETGSSDGYTISGPQPTLFDEQTYITIQFEELPVPVVIAARFIRDSSHTCPVANVHTFEQSFLQAGDRVVRLNEQGLQEGRQYSGNQGLVFIDVTNMGFCSANLYTLSIDERNRAFTRSVINAQTSGTTEILQYQQGLSGMQQLIAVDINAAFHNQRTLSGVNQRFFQHLWFANGFPDALATMLLTAIGRSKGVLNALMRLSTAQFREDIELRLNAWSQITEHLPNFGQNTAVQLLELLSGSYDNLSARIQEIIRSDDEIVDGLSATLRLGNTPSSFQLSRDGESAQQYTNPYTGHTFTAVPNHEPLGQGGEGSVILVTDESGNRKALKIFHVLDEFSTKSIKRLSEIMQKNILTSEYIVKPLEQWTDGRTLYQAMNYYPDGDLANLIMSQPGYVREHRDEITFQMVLAVAWLHFFTVVHRDIKPENFLVSISQKRVLLHDLGMIREMDNPDQMAESIFATPGMLGPNSANALKDGDSYNPVIMDWESLALSLIAVMTGGIYLFRDTTEKFVDFEYQTRMQARQFERLENGIYASGYQRKETLKQNIITELKNQMGYEIPVPESNLDFIVELLDVNPTEKVNNHKLIEMMRKYDFLNKIAEYNSDAQKLLFQYRKKTDPHFRQIEQTLPSHLAAQFVEPDGNCIPSAIAGAVNHQRGNSEWDQQRVRQLLVQKLNKILNFIHQLADFHIQINGLTRQKTAELAEHFMQCLIAITGIDSTELLQIQLTGGSEAQTGWMDPGLIALLPLLGVNTNIYGLSGNMDEPMIVYDMALWHINAAFLTYYLMEVGVVESHQNATTINLVHNGADNQSNGGHYYYATENDAAEQEGSDNPGGFEFIGHEQFNGNDTNCEGGCRPFGGTVRPARRY